MYDVCIAIELRDVARWRQKRAVILSLASGAGDGGTVNVAGEPTRAVAGHDIRPKSI